MYSCYRREQTTKPVSLLMSTVVWLLSNPHAVDFCYCFQLVITTGYEELPDVFHHFQKVKEPCANRAYLQEVNIYWHGDMCVEPVQGTALLRLCEQLMLEPELT